MANAAQNLIGVGLYTPSEAARLTGISATKIARWLTGHSMRGTYYEPLWSPQIDLGDGRPYLGFLDLMEARIADLFIARGLSAQRVRKAILLAREILGQDRPLATRHFRTDGRTVFLEVLDEGKEGQLLDLLSSQFAFRKVLEPTLKTIEYEGDLPARWWPRGKAAGVVVDPTRAFGQPIESASGVPVSTLVAAVTAEGSPEAAALTWAVPVSAVRRAIAFEHDTIEKAAA